MRLPHHLVRTSTGVFHFRQKVPLALQALLGMRVIKRSLGTRDARTAQLRAYLLASRYAEAFEQAWRQARMSGEDDDLKRLLGKTWSEFLKDPQVVFKEWRADITPTGFSIETNGTDEDGRSAMAAMRDFPALVGLLSQTRFAPSAPIVAAVPVSGISVGEAARKYLLALDSATVPDKTKSQKRAAVNGFAQWKGVKQVLGACTRTDVSEWVQSLRANNLATPTLANKSSYLKAFFAWCQTAGYYPAGDNPAGEQVKYGTREKRLRRKLGFQPFTAAQIGALYAPQALATLTESVRWGALIGLYTGARVSEVGQLSLDDFLEVDGVPCFRITAQGAGQSLKTDASERAIPIHPDLVQLGILERVKALRAAGETRFFPRLKIASVNGSGNFLSKAFGRYIESLGFKAATGKIGFHSLRKTVVQVMQGSDIPAEYRAQYVGHELDDEHHAAYSRQYTPKELAAAIHPALRYGLNLAAIRALLTSC